MAEWPETARLLEATMRHGYCMTLEGTMANPARDLDTALHDFLDWEANQPERWEFINGEPRMMTGGTEAHAVIPANLIAALKNGLKGQPCRVYSSDMKIVTAQGDALYPDASVSCGPPDPRTTQRYDPILVVEVLSPSTAADDYGRKRRSYQSIPSLRYYMIVAQDRAMVELYTRHEMGWLIHTAEGLEAMIRLDALAVDLALVDLFEGIPTESLDPPLTA